MIRTITPPTLEPITLEDARLHCSIDACITTWDGMLRGSIAGARAHAEHRNVTGRCFAPRVMEIALDAWPASGHISLETAPVQSILQVDYVDAAGLTVSILPGDGVYELDSVSEPCVLRLLPAAAWPAAGTSSQAVRVRFVAGYAPLDADQATLTAALRMHAPTALQWMLIQVGHAYRNREADAGAASEWTDRLLDPLRIYLE